MHSYRMYDRYDNHCRYFGIVSKLTKNPLKRSTGIAVTGPTNTATCTFCTGVNLILKLHSRKEMHILLLLAASQCQLYSNSSYIQVQILQTGLSLGWSDYPIVTIMCSAKTASEIEMSFEVMSGDSPRNQVLLVCYSTPVFKKKIQTFQFTRSQDISGQEAFYVLYFILFCTC